MARNKIVKTRKKPFNWSKELDGLDYLVYFIVIAIASIVFFLAGGSFNQLLQAMKSL